jgi:hypothetical protein
MEKHVNYADLVGKGQSWGRNMEKEEKEHPTKETLMLASSLKTLEVLQKVLKELEKINKKITIKKVKK